MEKLGHKVTSEDEKKFWQRAYNIGMQNDFCSGKINILYGDFISKDDCLNINSCVVINSIKKLYDFFQYGNWCLGQAVMHKNLCFIQQVDGGDEWLTIKNFDDEAIEFESCSFQLMNFKKFKNYISRMIKASKEQCLRLEY